MQRRKNWGRAAPVAAYLVAALLSAAAGPVAADPRARGVAATTCRDVEVPVNVAARADVIAGTLCVPPEATTVQVLVPGNTYNRSYWQADIDPARYSYVRQANLAGYATLAVDRLGTGDSLHPSSEAMTLKNDVTTVHEVVTAVRAGAFGIFERVVGVGHSLGSVVVNQVAGEHPDDFDALVLTGFSHSINLANATARVASRYASPAGDPKFAGRDLDAFYLTTQPDGRAGLYTLDAVPTEVLAWDDRTRDTANMVEIAGLGGFQVPNVSRAITAPVLILNGSEDALACGVGSGDCATSPRLRDSERPWFGPGTDLTAWSVPGLGHNVTMHDNVATVNADITGWMDNTVGSGGAVRGSRPGTIPGPSAEGAGTPDPAALAANQALTAATSRMAEAYADAAEPVSGLGDGSNPVPAYNDLLRAAADLAGQATATDPGQPRRAEF